MMHTYKNTHTHTQRERLCIQLTHTHTNTLFALSVWLSCSESIKLKEELCVWGRSGKTDSVVNYHLAPGLRATLEWASARSPWRCLPQLLSARSLTHSLTHSRVKEHSAVPMSMHACTTFSLPYYPGTDWLFSVHVSVCLKRFE